jgi:hypothetical protein
MIIDILKIIISSRLLALPFAIFNAYIFHGKGDPKESIELFVLRILFSSFLGLIFSCMITHLTLLLKSEYDSWNWIFYPVGFFFCIPYFMKSLMKECKDVDHGVDGVGMHASVLGFILVIVFWESFFSDPYRAGFIFEFSSAIKSI